MTDHSQPQSVSVDLLSRIDSVCANYEDDNARGDAVSLESYLTGFEGFARSELLRELLALDFELRQQRGEQPQQSDYKDLSGAGDQTVVRAMFDSTMIVTDGEAGQTTSSGNSFELGSQLGPYRLEKCLGEGGMGTVYLANQEEPIARQVALKVVKSDLSSKRVLERFRQEQQALAAMDHPNVARVLDAGTSLANTPYFVMEYVDGLPITEYCAERKLGLRERLALFVQVCQAVQHAHQKGIIHRDLKPSNVMVTQYDEEPVPKVIDFGLATAIREGAIRNPSQTEVGTVMGTFQYMSPEQADSGNADIDTRSDIYSLGVLLYELLSGVTPLSKDSVAEGSLFEILKQIRETEAIAPSKAIHEPSRTSIPNELDWISLRALAKNRDDRYETATAFAEDIQRYLRDEPVLAGPPSAGYRMSKFIRRNRIPVVAASFALLSLLAGTVLAAVGLVQARHDRNLAESANDELIQANSALESSNKALDNQLAETEKAREAEAKAYDQAKVDEATTDAVNRFLSSILRSASPSRLGRDATVLGALDYASKNIDTEFPDRPRVKMAILSSLASTYSELGEYVRAEDHAIKAVGLYSETVGENHEATLRAKSLLAGILSDRGNYAQAAKMFRDIGSAMRDQYGMENRGTLIAYNNLATMLANQRKTKEAIAILEEVLAAKRKLLGETDDTTLATWGNLASLKVSVGEKEAALKSMKTLYGIVQEKHGEKHPMAIDTLDRLALVQSYIDVREAMPSFRKLVELRSEVFGQDHPLTVRTLMSLSTALLGSGEAAEAEPHLRRIVDWDNNVSQRRRRFGAEAHLIQSLAFQGKGKEAEKVAQGFLDGLEEHLPPDDPRVLRAKSLLGASFVAQDRNAEAEELLGECYQGMRATTRGVPAEYAGFVQTQLGIALQKLERVEEAEALLKPGVELLQQTVGDHHVATARATEALTELDPK